jgi:UDP-N-acetylglucosamine:LPS N-acetylglucosamine transferase
MALAQPTATSALSPGVSARAPAPGRLLLVCSAGGHLAQLHRLEHYWTQHDRRWVTFDKAHAQSLLREEDVVWAYHPTTRNVFNLARNWRLARKVLDSYAPDVVISNGAGVAFPFFVEARRRGIRTVYIEVYDRFDSRTLTGRLCEPFTDLFALQWPEQRDLYRDGVVIGPLL